MTPTGAGVVLALVLAGMALPAGAQEAAAEGAFSPRGADTCLKCHDEDSKFPVLGIFRTPHGQKADPRAPFAGAQCEACHGPGADHARNRPPGEPQGPIVSFGARAGTPAAVQDRACLACHAGAARTHWPGSAHEAAEVPCAACHQVHAPADPALRAAAEPEVCGACHVRERAASLMASGHALRQGRMACSDCHNPHGGAGDALLAAGNVNETCFDCHADKRGPFLWEHAPAAEDCTLCHAPHGSPHRAMLTQRPPLLCQQCHAQAGHPSIALTPAGLPGSMPSAFLLGSGCVNCHAQVHGSNHPSGADLGR